ncbi:hypothetical protein PRIPAC_95668, partial [Pristionchus pacificus]|uniref:Collagen n=1 Tax=Pristionchus pacificus TaxID=54126 RepID=A0A2A6CHA1_PRIPA
EGISSVPSRNMDKEAAYEMAMRRMAIGAVVLSTASLVSLLIVTPLLLIQIQSLHSDVISETDFCKVRSRDMYSKLVSLEPQSVTRMKREDGGHWDFGKWIPDGGAGGGAGGYERPADPVISYYPAAVEADAVSACGCTCMQGPMGPPGEPGDDGADGVDGEVGVAGKSGRDGEIVASDGVVNEPCVICPPGPIGAPGAAGNKGPQGPRGAPGAPGIDGRRGEPGMIGPAGPMGVPGPEGARGKKGEDGRIVSVNGPPGPVGPRGPQGRKGEKGSKGRAGVAIPGPQGPVGEVRLETSTRVTYVFGTRYRDIKDDQSEEIYKSYPNPIFFCPVARVARVAAVVRVRPEALDWPESTGRAITALLPEPRLDINRMEDYCSHFARIDKANFNNSEQLLAIYDATSTGLIIVLLLVTSPLATCAYRRLLSAKQFRSNYSIRMVVLNGAAELLNCFFFTIANQLTTFPFAYSFYEFLMKHNVPWPLCSISAFLSVLSIHTRFYVAITRLAALIPFIFRRINTPLIFIICAASTILGTVPAILDIVAFNTFSYVIVEIGDSFVFIPYTNRTVMVLKDIDYCHLVVMSALTLIANLLLSLTLFRKRREIAAVTNSKRSNQERGLIITSIVSYLVYMIFFVNSYFAREFEWAWCAFSQFLFLGVSSLSPFWCLMLFSGTIRATVLRRNVTVETRTIAHTYTVHHK